MQSDTVLKVEGVYKKFSRNIRRSMLYGSTDIFRSMLGIDYNSGKLRKGEFWSLQDINFELKRGEIFGLVGSNGSGKSTLLRLINGIFPPDSGKISVRGNIGALIAVGAGFHPHMTGRENIYLNGTILGMTKGEIEEKFDEIVDFAEIGEFIDNPVSIYSSGMYLRLGFAIAINSLPDIVLIDEVLAVGDAQFQRKCLNKIQELKEKGGTIIVVSHNTQNIGAMCDRALLLDKGRQILVDSAEKVISAYELMQNVKNDDGVLDEVTNQINSTAQPSKKRKELQFIEKFDGYGTDEVTIERIRLIDKSNKPTVHLNNFDTFTIEVNVDSALEIKKAYIWASFRFIVDRNFDDKNHDVLGFKKEISLPKGKSTIRIQINSVALATGEYKIKFNIMDDFFLTPYIQGKYGYIKVRTDIPTMLRVNQGTSGCFIDPVVEIENTNTK